MIVLNKDLPRDVVASHATPAEAEEIIAELEHELQYSSIPGIGLAAPQIGINKAVAIVRIPNKIGYTFVDPTEPVRSVNLVNPRLIDADKIILYQEGCLSFPNQSCQTVRFSSITLETDNDYEFYSEQINARRYNTIPKQMPLFAGDRRTTIYEPVSQFQEVKELEQLVSVCIQHEFAHLLGLTMFDFTPQKTGRNDLCLCGSKKKNKKCHNQEIFNINLQKFFNPTYPK